MKKLHQEIHIVNGKKVVFKDGDCLLINTRHVKGVNSWFKQGLIPLSIRRSIKSFFNHYAQIRLNTESGKLELFESVDDGTHFTITIKEFIELAVHKGVFQFVHFRDDKLDIDDLNQNVSIVDSKPYDYPNVFISHLIYGWLGIWIGSKESKGASKIYCFEVFGYLFPQYISEPHKILANDILNVIYDRSNSVVFVCNYKRS